MKELIEFRKKRGYTQKELSNISGVSQQAISNYEKGLRTPDSDNLKKLALALQISADVLLGITEEVQKFKSIQKSLEKEVLFRDE